MKGWMVKRGSDFWTALFLMIFSGAVIREALDLDLGTPHNPGSGFVIFGTAVVLGVLALLQFIKALLALEPTGQAKEKIHRWRVLSVIGANVLYVFALEPVGFLLCTFLLLSFLFQAYYDRGRWLQALGGAALTSLLTYLLFSRLLHLNLPKGLIPFF
jgi:putative tricarboxylic transport membrane protein